MAGTARQRYKITTEETRNISVDFKGLLDSGELLSGTPVVASDSNINLSNKQVNASQLVINNRTVQVGEAVSFTLSNASEGKHYIEVRCSTDAGQVVEGLVVVEALETLY